ncbi:MAG: UDP-3-O-(3-hydroxymyristoyl)glucosamine N-acyltransferase [Bacteroidales bacterium]|jgi:UDP-3-O-[3-hydroxymyristoyl] glucosamine N-acyltransferase|nr:UDP-3-O-(3-hydroxymyristoyl)glucosamine N-acyltransferase [Bacteroidales bacterium]
MKFEIPILLKDIVAMISQPVKLIGNSEISVTGINEIHSIEAGDLTFVDNNKYYNRVLKSAAGTILIDKEIEAPESKTLLIVKDPLCAYTEVMNHFIHFNPQQEMIHPFAQIGERTIIQPGVFVGENVVIGKNCLIHANVSIYADTIIGDNVIIHSGSVLGADAFYFQRRKEGWVKLESCGRTLVGNNVEIGCGVYIDRGVSGDTVIGDGCKLDNIIQIGHDTRIGTRCLIGSQSAIAGCTVIGDDCRIWAKCSINKDLHLANGTTLLAHTAINKSVEKPNQILFGIPADESHRKWREIVGVKMLPELMKEFAQLKKEVAELKEKSV